MHAIAGAEDASSVMLNLSIVNITPFDARDHVEEVEKTPEDPQPIQP